MLQFAGDVLELFQGFHHVVWHEQMHLLFVAVSVQCDSNVLLPCPIAGEFVMFFECVFEMLGVFLADVFDSKVIHDSCVLYGPCVVFPKTRY